MSEEYNISSKVAFNYSTPLIINDSDVPINSSDLWKAFNLREHEQYIQYKPVACVFGVLIFLSNIVVVISSGLILKKGQQTKSTYLLLGNVSLADTIIGVSMLFGVFVENTVSSSPLCIFQIGMLVCPAMVSIFTVGLIAVDRYIYILHGLYYHRWVNTTKVRISIIFVWIIGVTLGFLPFTGWTTHEFGTKCYYVAIFPKPLILINSVLSIVPIIVVAVLYTIILVRALKNVRQINSNVKSSKSNNKPEMRIYRGNGNIRKNNTQSVKIPKNDCCKIKRSSSFNVSYDMKHKKHDTSDTRNKSKSNDDLNAGNTETKIIAINKKTVQNRIQYESGISICSTSTCTLENSTLSINRDPEASKQNKKMNDIKTIKPKDCTKWRAIIIVMLTTGSFICTWMPFFITVIFYVFCEDNSRNPECFNLRILLGGPIAALAFLNSILNPLIYVWWHKGFQRNIQVYLKRYVYPMLCTK